MPSNIQESPPPATDHRTAPNPYLSLYGTNWVAKINNSVTLKHTCDIRELVTHAYDKTKQAFANTKYRDNFFFYNDALSQMNNKETTDLMN